MKSAIGLAALLGVVAAAADASAQCCPGYELATACAGAALTKSRWCIQSTVPTGQAALPAEFCSYGDKVISTLETVFNIQAPSIFEFELDTKTGGAHTGTACNGFGDGAAYDGFTGNAYGVTSFWGYLLSLHEAINDWTGMSSGGWPTDWWADHQSAFPNLMDFHVMNSIGTANTDANLIKASVAQKGRFYPGGDTADPKVVALDNVFMAMPNMDGFAGFSRLFALQSGDGVSWDSLGVPNPDVKRSEYVVAYMSLAAQQAVLKLLQGPGANGGGNICNDTPDGITGDAPYTCSEAHVDAIATAHCSIAANGMPATDLKALRSGNYASIASGPCGSTCPAECACDATSHCVARWLVGAASDGGTEANGGSGSSGASSSTGASGGTGTSGGGGGGGTSSGSSSGAASGAGLASGSSGSTTLSSGVGVGSAGGASGDVGTGSASGGASGRAAGPTATAPAASGCGCGVIGSAPALGLARLFSALALAGLGLVRLRARRR